MEITFKNVSKSFFNLQRGVYKVITNLNFSITEPGLYCINGRSGVGKTTVLNMISGVLKPDDGQITVEPSKEISYCFQDNLLLPWLNVMDNLLLVLSSRSKLSNEDKVEKIKKLLVYFQMETKSNSLPSQLSGGQKQRINIIRSLLVGSKIVLLDEPFSFLDKKTFTLTEKYITDYSKKHNAIVIIITHRLPTKLKSINKLFTLISERDSDTYLLKREILG